MTFGLQLDHGMQHSWDAAFMGCSIRAGDMHGARPHARLHSRHARPSPATPALDMHAAPPPNKKHRQADAAPHVC